MKVNVIYALIATAVQLTLGFLLAVLVINMRPRWQSFYKIALYLPVIIPPRRSPSCGATSTPRNTA